MKEWDYKVHHMDTPHIDFQSAKLKGLGEKGWELVSVGSYRNLAVFYLKKPKKKE